MKLQDKRELTIKNWNLYGKHQKIQMYIIFTISQTTFVHILDDSYQSPTIIDFTTTNRITDESDNQYWINTDSALENYEVNVKKISDSFIKMVKEKNNNYNNDNNIFIPFGGYHSFISSTVPYTQMDELINYINKQYTDVKIKYSTLEEYFNVLNNINSTRWNVFEGNFLNYIKEPHKYDVGYYSSRMKEKILIQYIYIFIYLERVILYCMFQKD